MNKTIAYILIGYALLVTIALGFIVKQNTWAMQHPDQVSKAQEDFDSYVSNWKIEHNPTEPSK